MLSSLSPSSGSQPISARQRTPTCLSFALFSSLCHDLRCLCLLLSRLVRPAASLLPSNCTIIKNLNFFFHPLRSISCFIVSYLPIYLLTNLFFSFLMLLSFYVCWLIRFKSVCVFDLCLYSHSKFNGMYLTQLLPVLLLLIN